MAESSVYWLSRLVFERALALLFLTAFLGAANQFVPLLGARGLEPASRFVQFVPFRSSPSLFYLSSSDTAFRVAAWLGAGLSLVALLGPSGASAIGTGVLWASIWVLYLSFVNVGQTFYGFGWESLLLEMGFVAIFAGGRATAPSFAWIVILRWILFRNMFGAGLIKLRGDPCWRDLTCLDYYFETQPIPNALSWYFHWLPESVHRAGVMFNHVAELAVPFAYFAPQPIAAIAGLVTIAFQLVLIVSGNLSWLNWATIVLCIPLLDDRWFGWIPSAMPALVSPTSAFRLTTWGLAISVAILSVRPVLNMLSPSQLMNYSFNPLHIVNTYGAFGSITRARQEIVIEGTDAAQLGPEAVWHAYEFKGKPGDPARRPSQIAPYHLRLDWLMWFAAMSDAADSPWFSTLMARLLEGDRATIALLRTNPFPDRPPHFLRANLYDYRFTTPDERRRTGQWWTRRLVDSYMPPVALSARGEIRRPEGGDVSVPAP